MSQPSFVGTLLLASALTALTPSGAARAGGFESAKFGGERGYAAGQTPFAVYYNPAALAATKRVQVAGDMMLAIHGASYNRPSSDTPVPPAAAGANTGKSRVLDVLPDPTLAASLKVRDFSLGAGVFAPFAGIQRWRAATDFSGDRAVYPGAQDGSARWHAIDVMLLTLYGSVAAAYTIRPARLSFGVSANFIYSRIRLTRAQNATGTDDVETEGRTQLDATGFTGSASAGLMWEPRNRLWVALSYQMPPSGYGGMALHGKLRNTFTGDSDVTYRQSLPDILRWAIRYRSAGARKYELRLFGDYQRWSVLKNQCVSLRGTSCHIAADGSASPNVIANQPMHFRDTFAIRGGASYFVGGTSEILVGLGFESSAIRLKTLSPLVLDGNKINAALGVRTKILPGLWLMCSYAHWQMFSRQNNHSGLSSYSGVSKRPSANGHYAQWLGFINAMLEFELD